MYKRICTPIVQYKYDDRIGWCVYDISIVTHKNKTLNIYHYSADDDFLCFETKKEAFVFIINLISMNGYRPKILSKDFNTTWYNIQWIDLDMFVTLNYSKK